MLVHWARTEGWLVFYVPHGRDWTHGGFFYRNTYSDLFDTPVQAGKVLQVLMSTWCLYFLLYVRNYSIAISLCSIVPFLVIASVLPQHPDFFASLKLFYIVFNYLLIMLCFVCAMLHKLHQKIWRHLSSMFQGVQCCKVSPSKLYSIWVNTISCWWLLV
jgi:hypothetical protein